MARYLMQAVSDPLSVGGNGQLYGWVTTSPDWVGTGFPGPGTPIHAAVSEFVPEVVNVEGDLGDITPNRVVARWSTPAGPAEQATPTGGIELTTSGLLRTTAFTGDVVKDAGGTVTAFRNATALSLLGNPTNTTAQLQDVVGSTLGHVVGILTAGAISFGQLITASYGDATVTYPKLQDVVGLSVVGRSASTTGVPGAITSSADDQVIRRSGAVIGWGTIATGGITDGAVTNAKFRDSAGLSVVGRSANTTGPVADITAGADDQVLRRSGAVLGFGTVATGGIADGAITDAKLRNSAGLSVIGRSANTTGVPADIVAGSDDHVLRRSGTALGFGTVATGGITNNAVTHAKYQQIASDRLLGRDTAATGNVEEISLDTTLEFTGSLSIRRAALTGDVTASAGSNATAFRSFTGLSLLARTANTSGVPTEFTASVTNTAPYYNGTALVWGTLPSAAVTAPGGTGQVLYNNANALDGASGITVVGSETAFAFGSTTSTAGLIRVAHGATVVSGRNNANDNNVDVLRWGAAFPDQLIVGGSGVSFLNQTVASGGTFIWFTAASGTNIASLTASLLTFPLAAMPITNVASLASGGTPATTGFLRGAHASTLLAARNNANSANAALVQFGSGANDRLTLGDTAVAETYLNIASGGTYVVQINGATEYSLSSTTFNAQANSVSNAAFFSGTGTVAGAGLLRDANNTTLAAFRNQANTQDVAALASDTNNNLRLGQTTNIGSVLVQTATGQGVLFSVNNTTEWDFDAARLDAQGNNVTNVGFFGGTGTLPSGGLLRGAAGATLVASRHSSGNTATVLDYAFFLADALRIGDPTYVANLYYDVASGTLHRFRVAGTEEYVFSSTSLDYKTNSATNAAYYMAGATTGPTTGLFRAVVGEGGDQAVLTASITDIGSTELIASIDSSSADVIFGSTSFNTRLRAATDISLALNGTTVLQHQSTGDADLLGVNVSNASAKRTLIRGPGSTSSNNAGGFAVIRGGKFSGSGSAGGVRLELNANDSTVYPLVQVVDLGSENRRLVALAMMTNVSSTQMPSGAGDGVVYLANAQTIPTAAPTSGTTVYSDGGLSCVRAVGLQAQFTSLSMQHVGTLGGHRAKHQSVHARTQITASTHNVIVASSDLATLVPASVNCGIMICVKCLSSVSSDATEAFIYYVLVKRSSGTWSTSATELVADMTSDTDLPTFSFSGSTFRVATGNDNATTARLFDTFMEFWIETS